MSNSNLLIDDLAESISVFVVDITSKPDQILNDWFFTQAKIFLLPNHLVLVYRDVLKL